MRKIMIIDDSPEFLSLMEAWLEGEQFGVILCQDSRLGVERACDERPDLIVLDLVMPNKSGVQVLAELKAHQTTRSIPVIVLSAASRQSEENELLLKRLAADTVAKPFDFDDLLARVNRCLDAQRETSETG